MFDLSEGIKLPENLYVQARIRCARSSVHSHFTFLPNRLVTNQVFKTLLSFNAMTMLHGPLGISKSANIIFFCYLNYLIN